MRINIIQEGVPDRTGRVFEHGSLQSSERQIPVVMGGHHDATVGIASDFQSNGEGWISFDITFRADFLEQFKNSNDSVTDWFDFSGYARLLEGKGHDLITSAEIMAIYALPKPGIPPKLAEGIPVSTDKNPSDLNFVHDHKPTQHRDGKPPWCNICGRTASFEIANEKAAHADLPKDQGLLVDSPNTIRDKMGLGAVTPNIDYAQIAKRELVKYINKKAEKTDGFFIDVSYLYVVWFSKTLKNWKCLISTSLPDGMYYECTYNGETYQLYIDTYKKFDNVSVDL